MRHTSDSYLKTADDESYLSPSSKSLKRNFEGEPVVLTSGRGPLKFHSKNYVPVLDLDEVVRTKKKFTKITGPDEPSVKKQKETVVSSTK